MTILVQDSFNRADGQLVGTNADTGQLWQGNAQWAISSNQLGMSSYPGSYIYAYVDSGISDGTITADLSVTQLNFYLLFRYTDNSNCYIFGSNSSGIYRLWKQQAGAWSNLGSSVSAVSGDKLKIVLSGSSINIYVNDSLKLSVTNTFNQTATKHGFHSEGAGSGRFDNFQVEDFNTGTPTGTDGSTTLGLTQQIYSDSSVTLSLSQDIYKDTEAVLGLTQAIYRELENSLNLRQEIFADGQSLLNLIQEFYEDSQTFITLQLIQEIYKDSSSDLPLTQAIYKDSDILLPLRQEMYEQKETTLPLVQNIYKDGSEVLALTQTIYRDAFQAFSLVQQMYVEGEISLPLLIQVIDDWAQYNEVIRIILNISRKQANTLDIKRKQTASLEITQQMQSELKL